jgi:glycerate kinase
MNESSNSVREHPVIAPNPANRASWSPSGGTLADLRRHLQDDDEGTPPRADLRRRGATPPDGRITVLIAAPGAQQTLEPHEVAAAIEEGIHAAMPSARVLKLPEAASNGGFVEEVVRLSGGAITRIGLIGLRGEGTGGRLGLLGAPDDLTAIIAIDEAIEMGTLAPSDRDPTRASSHAAGELILAALEHGARRIILGCGDSGSNDGGIGMASVLGIRFLDAARTEIAEAGGLLRLASIDMSRRDHRLEDVTIEAVVNPSNDLLGPRGVTRVHGARMGATPTQVLRLERGLARYAAVVRESLGVDVAGLAGGGASGGLGAGLAAFLGARLRSPLDFLQVCPGLQEVLAAADLVITVEDYPEAHEAASGSDEARGSFAAAPSSRVPAWVTRQARAKGLPVIALPSEPLLNFDFGVGAGALPVVRAALISGEQAARHASARLRDASTAALRRVLSGWNLAAEQT